MSKVKKFLSKDRKIIIPYFSQPIGLNVKFGSEKFVNEDGGYWVTPWESDSHKENMIVTKEI